MPVVFTRLNQFMGTLFAPAATTKRGVVRALRLMSKIGIYSGSFNPVHSGHITFALQALEAAQLDQVYFMPERRPRTKSVEHFAHRVAMLKRALKPHRKFQVLELTDINFSVERTLPKLKHIFSNDSLTFLFGSDATTDMPNWPKIDRLVEHEIVVGLRQSKSFTAVQEELNQISPRPKKVILIDGYAPEVSSSSVRQALAKRTNTPGTLSSVRRYSNQHWLYVSFKT
jgi:nicotinate-nucleotide adenylyltransferase